MCMHACKGQKRCQSDPPEQELQEADSCSMWVLASKLLLSISPALTSFLKELLMLLFFLASVLLTSLIAVIKCLAEAT